ncbi:S10 family serine carboxypeptidase-like protein [Legionella pneumophila]
MSIFRSVLITLLFISSAMAATPDQVTYLPGWGPIKNNQYAGYFPVNPKAGLFYWFVESNNTSMDAPIVLWLNGGPGAASLYGFFMENGPYQVDKNGELTARKDSWTKAANYLVIDQPAGVGYSYGSSKSYGSEGEAIDQLQGALQLIFKKHPELYGKPLFLAGESYAGKYLPQLAIRLLKDKNMNLKGLLLGDPWINPRLQQKANIDYAYYHGLIDNKARKRVRVLYENCVKEIDKQSPSTSKANKTCEQIQEFIKQESGGLNLANIATGVEPEDTNMVNYLNQKVVREALHIPVTVSEFKTFSTAAAKKLEIGEQDSVADLYPQLLAAGIRILIYNGLEDGKDSNFLSTELLLASLDWHGKNAFAKAPTCIWRTNNEVSGYAKGAVGLTQVKIRGAGHLAPIDQPARVFDLFKHFINDKPLC